MGRGPVCFIGHTLLLEGSLLYFEKTTRVVSDPSSHQIKTDSGPYAGLPDSVLSRGAVAEERNVLDRKVFSPLGS